MAIKIKNVKERVKQVLLEREDSRDCDQKLFALILFQELKEKMKDDERLNPKILTAQQFLKLMSLNKMTNFESVRRARALLQECPKNCSCTRDGSECEGKKYRGKKWEERKGYEEKVKSDVITFHSIDEVRECIHIWIPILDEEHSHYCRLCKKQKKR